MTLASGVDEEVVVKKVQTILKDFGIRTTLTKNRLDRNECALRFDEAAEMLGFANGESLRVIMANGNPRGIPYFRLGGPKGNIRFRKSALLEWIQRRSVADPEAVAALKKIELRQNLRLSRRAAKKRKAA